MGVIGKWRLLLLAGVPYMDASVAYAREGGLPQLDTASYPSQIFWLAVHAIILYLLLSKLVIPRIQQSLDMRARRIEDSLSRAEKAQHEAEDIAKTHEARLGQARADAHAILHEAKAEIATLHLRHEKEIQDAMADRFGKIEEHLAKNHTEAIRISQLATEKLTDALVERVAGVKPAAPKVQEEVRRSWSSGARTWRRY